MLIKMVVATNPFRSDLISQNQLFKASFWSLKSLTLFKTLQDEKERNFLSDRQDKSCEKLVKALLQNLSIERIEISRSTLQRTLKEGLKWCRPRKTTLLNARHVKAWLYFARNILKKRLASGHQFYGLIKIELFGHRDISFVWGEKRWSF